MIGVNHGKCCTEKRFIRRLAALVLPCLSLALASPASAVSERLSTPQMFDLARQAEEHGDAARVDLIYDALAHNTDLDVRCEARFRHAKFLMTLHHFAEAAVLYRQIIDERPGASPVRLELAAALARMGDVRGARQALRQAQAGGLPPEVAQVVKQYAAALRSRKPWGGSLELAFAPDSNINRATSQTTLDTVIAPLTLSQDARQRSGLGLKESSQIYARVDAGQSLTLVPRLSSQAVVYSASQFNDVTASAQLGLEWRRKADRITPSAGFTWRWYGNEIYARTQSVSIDWLHPSGPRAQIETALSVNLARYPRNTLQDGTIYTASLSYERAFTARSGGSVSITGNRQTARDPGYATTSVLGGAVYWHDFGKVTLFGNLSGSRLLADERLFLFPERRADWYVRIGTGAVLRKIQVAGFSPVLRVGYERNWSRVGIYDFSRVTTDMGITRAF